MYTHDKVKMSLNYALYALRLLNKGIDWRLFSNYLYKVTGNDRIIFRVQIEEIKVR